MNNTSNSRPIDDASSIINAREGSVMSKKKFDSRLMGGIFLIVGTCIGGGMLALPISNAPSGFITSTALLFFGWFVMTMGALLILEVNLRLPRHSNIITMAKSTLHRPGQIVAWICYMFLLYTLLSAYLAGGTDILNNLFHMAGLPIPTVVSSILLTAAIAWLVYRGIIWVDYVNRGLIFGKFGAYFLLIILIVPFVSFAKLNVATWDYATSALFVLATSFGFSTIVPSIRSYFEDDVKKIRKAIIIGSLIPLVFYFIWNLIILGALPREGEGGLIALISSSNHNTGLANTIANSLQRPIVTEIFRVFSSICIFTSFIGVALGLIDFLADGLKLSKKGSQGMGILSIAFLPPLAIVIFHPGIFLSAIKYAGILCFILLLLLPALMAWSSRYYKQADQQGYQVMGGKGLLVVLILFSVGLLWIAAQQAFG